MAVRDYSFLEMQAAFTALSTRATTGRWPWQRLLAVSLTRMPPHRVRIRRHGGMIARMICSVPRTFPLAYGNSNRVILWKLKLSVW